MALHDVDMNNGDRGAPRPNAPDTIPVDTRMAHNTMSTTFAPPNETQLNRVYFDNNRIVSSNGNNINILIGPDANGNQVLKVAQPGYDADSAADENLIFNSSNNIFKIVSTGTVDLEATSPGSDTATVTHGLNKQPLVIAFANNIAVPGGGGFISGNTMLPYYNLILVGGVFSIDIAVTCSVSSTQIIFDMLNRYGSDVGTTIRYYILEETSGVE